jgi:predicted acyl esterase
MHQWGIASDLPSALGLCIAPWECTTDLYRESFFEGCFRPFSFNKFIAGAGDGPNGVDDQVGQWPRCTLT